MLLTRGLFDDVDGRLFGEPEPRSFGTDSRLLARRDDPDTSHEAAASIDTTRLEQMVLDVIASFGESGCISDEVQAKLPGFAYSSVTARYKALIDKGFVVVGGDRRPGKSGRGQRVMKASRG